MATAAKKPIDINAPVLADKLTNAGAMVTPVGMPLPVLDPVKPDKLSVVTPKGVIQNLQDYDEFDDDDNPDTDGFFFNDENIFDDDAFTGANKKKIANTLRFIPSGIAVVRPSTVLEKIYSNPQLKNPLGPNSEYEYLGEIDGSEMLGDLEENNFSGDYGYENTTGKKFNSLKKMVRSEMKEPNALLFRKGNDYYIDERRGALSDTTTAGRFLKWSGKALKNVKNTIFSNGGTPPGTRPTFGSPNAMPAGGMANMAYQSVGTPTGTINPQIPVNIPNVPSMGITSSPNPITSGGATINPSSPLQDTTTKTKKPIDWTNVINDAVKLGTTAAGVITALKTPKSPTLPAGTYLDPKGQIRSTTTGQIAPASALTPQQWSQITAAQEAAGYTVPQGYMNGETAYTYPGATTGNVYGIQPNNGATPGVMMPAPAPNRTLLYIGVGVVVMVMAALILRKKK